MTKIIVSGDLLRPDKDGNCHQINNITWLENLVKPILSNFQVLYPVKALSFEEWYKTDSETKLISVLTQSISKEDIIIGFEIPTNSLIEFERFGIRYIDVNVHPIRFLNKKVLGLRSNFFDFSDYIVPETDFVEGTKQYQGYAEITERFDLLVGQTEIDRSLLFNGKMVKLQDYQTLFNNNKYLVYKPHPLDLSNNKDLIESLKIPVIDPKYNIYQLFATKSCSQVMGISSSSIYEAKYFGKLTKFFQERVYHSTLIPVYEEDFINNILPKIK